MGRIFISVQWPYDVFDYDRFGGSIVVGTERRERLIEVLDPKHRSDGLVQGMSRNGTPILTRARDLICGA